MRSLKLAALPLLALLGIFTISADVAATERMEWGERDTSYSGDLGYNRSISGATWYYYEIPKGYSDPQEYIQVPFSTNYGNKTTVPINNCRTYGGFWALLRNEYNRAVYRQTNGDRSASLTGHPAATATIGEIRTTGWEGTDGHITYLNDSDFGGKAIEDSTKIGDYTIRATIRGDWGTVETAFKKVKGTSAVPSEDGLDVSYEWNTASELSYFCSAPPNEEDSISYEKKVHRFSTISMGYDDTNAVAGADYTSTSKPVMDGVSFIGTSYTVPMDTTIRLSFNHYLAIEDNVDAIDKNRVVNWQQTGYGSSSASKTLGDISDRDTWSYLFPNYSTVEIAQSGDISVEVSDDMQVCQYTSISGTTSYSFSTATGSFSYGSAPSSNTSGACVILKVDRHSVSFHCDNVNGSPVAGANYTYSEDLANTTGVAGVRKNTDPIVYTDGGHASSEVSIYAKPGDAIRFYHSVCFGANDAKPNPKQGYRWKTITGNFTTNNNISSVFEIKNNDGNYGFVFGRADPILNKEVYVRNENLRNGTLGKNSFYSEALKTSSKIAVDLDYISVDAFKREIGVVSPDDHAQSVYSVDFTGEYDCAFYSSLIGSSYSSYSDLSTGVYRIPGLQKENALCNSSYVRNKDRAFQSSVVGSTVSQTLSYRVVSAWPAKVQMPDGSTREFGSAGDYCTNDYYDAAYTAMMVNGGSKWTGTEVTYQYDKNGNLVYDKNGNPKVKKTESVQSGIACYNASSWTDKTAKVSVPYNFNTVATANIENSGEVLYPGTKVESTYQVDITPRVNPVTSDKESNGALIPYATITPPNTHVNVVEFVVKDTVDPSDSILASALAENNGGINSGWKENGDGSGNGNLCAFYRSVLGDKIPFGGCQEKVVKGQGALACEGENCESASTRNNVGNNMSNPLGENRYYFKTLKKIVPDIEAGYKYCTAVGINYGDSHGYPNSDLSSNPSAPDFGGNGQSVNKIGIGSNPSPYWHISAASCKTIAKKPNFQVWNAGTYSSGSITAALTNKITNAILGEPVKYDSNQKQLKKPEYYFGSWDEYYVISNKTVNGFASASALSYNGQWLNSEGVETKNSSFCSMSRLTISNRECKNGVAGNSGITDEDTNASIVVQRLLARYANINSSGLSPSEVPDINDTSKYTDIGSFTTSGYIKISGDYVLNDIIIQSAGTRIIQVDGHLTINRNICLGNPDDYDICQNPDSNYGKNTNNLSLAGRNITEYNNIADIPQVLIIADSIGISGEVSQIDAWLITADLIAGDMYSDGGYVNTCDNFVDGRTGTDDCWRTLKINGPVLTSSLLLNRTGGAWPGFSGDIGNPLYESTYVGDDLVSKYTISYENDPNGERIENGSIKKSEIYNGGYDKNSTSANYRDLTCDGSITPAEIFDLHPMTYLWAYYQASRTQASITYARELAPRY